MKRSLLALLCWLAFGCKVVVGQEEAASQNHYSYSDGAFSNDYLPAYIQVNEGGITLFADFENKTEKGVPLYLINDTSEELNFESQDGDVLLKLEYLNDEGRWIRAQGHWDSMCGNSYFSVSLGPGKWRQFSGYSPEEGTSEEVRYRCYGWRSFISNVGEGKVLAADVEAAEMDRLSVRSIPSAIVETIDPFMGSGGSTSEKLNEILVAADLLSSFFESRRLRSILQKHREAFQGSDPEGAVQIGKILEDAWPKDPKADELVETCLAWIRPASGASNSEQTMAWAVLRSVIREWRYLSMSADPNLVDVVSPLVKKADTLSMSSRTATEFARCIQLCKIDLEPFSETLLSNWVETDQRHLVKLAS